MSRSIAIALLASLAALMSVAYVQERTKTRRQAAQINHLEKAVRDLDADLRKQLETERALAADKTRLAGKMELVKERLVELQGAAATATEPTAGK